LIRALKGKGKEKEENSTKTFRDKSLEIQLKICERRRKKEERRRGGQRGVPVLFVLFSRQKKGGSTLIHWPFWGEYIYIRIDKDRESSFKLYFMVIRCPAPPIHPPDTPKKV
jgi:hypothetical protein